MTVWQPDVLGEEFECTEIDLGHDFEGPVCATLVRALPQPLHVIDRLTRHYRLLENCDILYVHGWSDYFFQKQLARFFTTRGARFFALDLRKYGRSLREGQTFGYIEDLSEYDEEIDAAIRIMNETPGHDGDTVRKRRKPRKLVLLGHSTGGLVLSLWADRHRGMADALVLNSPWLELQISAAARRMIAPMVNLRAKLNPHEVTLPQLDLGFYTQAQRASCTPEEFKAINLLWRPEQTMPVRAGWLKAIIAGQERLSAGVDVAMPVCTLLSLRSSFGVNWNEDMLRCDTVLDVNAVARAALKLGSSINIEWLDGALHDVFLSEQHVRQEAYERLEGWLTGWRAIA